MALDVSVFGSFILLFMVIIGLISYFLGRRKTNHPIITAVIGMFVSFIPFAGLIYVAFLALKQDVNHGSVS
ncbi:hypothetical protein EXU30_12720 [Shewanella maritima]|uniref:Uncharacterized protein n=1 Tax=Shewanella maritima TaxID=2520507 RepID=A0A411PIU9_9GAMM|nr:hypothetical protein [Shewanella maritima]QBF83465.1 hypothetical protein EXU30_12720 [Shewanella maritima]